MRAAAGLVLMQDDGEVLHYCNGPNQPIRTTRVNQHSGSQPDKGLVSWRCLLRCFMYDMVLLIWKPAARLCGILAASWCSLSMKAHKGVAAALRKAQAAHAYHAGIHEGSINALKRLA